MNGHVDSVLVRSRRNSTMFGPKSSACNHQNGQAKERVKPCGVLGKPTVVNLLQTQQVLDDMERALPPRSQRDSHHVGSGAFGRHTQDLRSLLAQEFSTRPL